MCMKRIAIIGAGPAGATAAFKLAQDGHEVTVFESGSRAGGLSQSIPLWGQTVDLGPHRFFTANEDVNRLWFSVVGNAYRSVDRLTRVFYKDRFYYYPLRPFNVLANLGPVESVRCLGSYAAAIARQKATTDDFESWVTARFGSRLYRTFFKTYSEKLWGIPCSELSADFAAQRIRKLSLYEAVKNSIIGSSGRQHETLVDHFVYPKGGTGWVYEQMVKSIRDHRGTVHFDTPVAHLGKSVDDSWTVQTDRTEYCGFDSVVSSMPVTTLISSVDNVPDSVHRAAQALPYRNTILVFLRVAAQELFPDQWLYIHSPELQVGRITNFRNWVPELYGSSDDSILCCEYWCNSSDPIWTGTNADWEQRASREVAATGLVDQHLVKDVSVIRIERSYPVYSRGYHGNLDIIKSFMNSCDGLWAVGRNGTFKYNNQDDSILMGMMAAREISEGRPQDIWGVTTDFETYREDAPLHRGTD